MSFPISPGVYNREQDYTNSVPTLATSTAALAGIFNWGPLFVPYFISSQKQYKAVFGPCTANNFETYMSGWNFLEYGHSLFVVRAANTTANSSGVPASNTALNAVGGLIPVGASGGPTTSDVLSSVVLNTSGFYAKDGISAYPSTVNYVAKWPGAKGNTLRVSQCDSANQYHSNVLITGGLTGAYTGNTYNGAITFVPGSNTANLIITLNAGQIAYANLFANTITGSYLTVGDIIKVSSDVRGTPYQYLQTSAFGNGVTNTTATSVQIKFTRPYMGSTNTTVSASLERYWQYYRNAPAPTTWISNTQLASSANTIQDLMQVVVVDEDGVISGVRNTILEVYNNLSRATDSVSADGTSTWYHNVINTQSPYIWHVNDRTGSVSNTASNLTNVTATNIVLSTSLAGGQDGDSETTAPLQTLINGWSLFQGVENITIDLVIAGKSVGSTIGNYGLLNGTYNNFGLASWLISNIAQIRKDCVVFFSPDRSIVLNNSGSEALSLIDWASLIPPSTYAFMDNNYKYQYDSDNNVYRWVPFNGDVAGLCAYTDSIAHPWVSPAGFNRGVISNVTQVAYNAQEGDRDLIYPQGINPIVSFPGRGTVLYGDRTFTTQSTGFNRINVRRLFLVVERAIKAFAQNTLFELNDVFTQNQFKNMITPYLRSIVGNNGISDFLIDCDNTINTATVADNEEFLCAIYIKPIHSINFIQITYVNTPTGTSFSTVENLAL